MLSLYSWNPKQHNSVWMEAATLTTQAALLTGSDNVYWIDLCASGPEEENLVFSKILPIHRLTLEDITKPRREPDAPPHFPKVEEFPDYLFVIVNPLRQSVKDAVEKKNVPHSLAKDGLVSQLSAVLTPKVLITHHYEPIPAVDSLRNYLSKHESQAERGPDFLFHIILDAIVDEYAPVLDYIEESLDEIETHVFKRPTQHLLLRLLQMKHDIIILRKGLIYEREVLARLSRGEFSMIDERERIYYRNVYDHLIRFAELMEGAREMVGDLMQTHLAAQSNKLNEIMKVLTMMSTIILPMTLIAGIYGMNFSVLPEKDWDWGYPFALGLMALTGIASFGFFRWRKWI